MNTGYLIYQAERTRSAAEQRQVDMSNAQLAASIGRMWRALAAPVRSRRARALDAEPIAPDRPALVRRRIAGSS